MYSDGRGRSDPMPFGNSFRKYEVERVQVPKPFDIAMICSAGSSLQGSRNPPFFISSFELPGTRASAEDSDLIFRLICQPAEISTVDIVQEVKDCSIRDP